MIVNHRDCKDASRIIAMKTRFVHIIFAKAKRANAKKVKAKWKNAKTSRTKSTVQNKSASKTLKGRCLGSRSSLVDRSLDSHTSLNRKGENSLDL